MTFGDLKNKLAKLSPEQLESGLAIHLAFEDAWINAENITLDMEPDDTMNDPHPVIRLHE